MLADELDYVVGVDTHRDEHVLAVVVVPTGAVVAQRSLPATAHGYVAALRFAGEVAPGRRLWAIEGAGHYGAGLARHLAAHDELVHESVRSTRAERRLRGKDDPLDAVRAARSVIGTGTRATPRSGDRQEALRVLMVARRSAVDVRRVALVQLRSLIVTAPEIVRQELRLLPVSELVRRCSASAARALAATTISLPSSRSVPSPNASRRPLTRQRSSSGRSSPTSGHLCRSSSSSRASGRSPPGS
jgi:hypothetical protein